MSTLNFEQLMSTCDLICELLTTARAGTFYSRPTMVVESFHFELLKYAVFLADADGEITEDEVAFIREKLHITAQIGELESFKKCERIPDGFVREVPLVIRYAATADVKRSIPADPFSNQKAQILVDAYRVYGETFLALFESEPTMRASRAITSYMQFLECFLTAQGVCYREDAKLFKLQSQEEREEPVPEFEVPYGSFRIKDGKAAGRDKKPQKEPEETLEKKLEEFNSMIGLEGVKQEVNSLVNLIRIQQIREKNGMRNVYTTKHMVFTGNPGTGKTTVARILASIYKDLGVLKKGQLIEVDRSGLVKGYLGQTAENVKSVIDQAMDGILFIDEAYTLTVNKGDGDYGQEAVDTLLKAMEDHRENLIVIVAGYPELMHEFIDSNPGLKSRFNKFIHFQDYTPQQQLEILEKMCEQQEYTMTEEARQYALRHFLDVQDVHDGDFANARDVRNFLENAITRQASRLIQLTSPTRDELLTLEAEDFGQGR